MPQSPVHSVGAQVGPDYRKTGTGNIKGKFFLFVVVVF